MLMEFFAAIALGFGAAGVALMARRLSGGRLPRTLVPVAAGLGMLGFAIWSEYSWFDRHSGALPEGIVVTTSVRESSGWRPWTWAAPFITRYAAVNAAGARQNPNLPGMVLADVYLVSRHAPPIVVPHIVDCRAGRSAELLGEVSFDDEGLPKDAPWRPLAADDPLYRALCNDTSAIGLPWQSRS